MVARSVPIFDTLKEMAYLLVIQMLPNYEIYICQDSLTCNFNNEMQ